MVAARLGWGLLPLVPLWLARWTQQGGPVPGRVTLLVDFLADPDDAEGFSTLLHWVDREAQQADSDKIRTFAMHGGFRRLLRKAGHFQVKSTVQLVAKINGVDVASAFYQDTDRWHVTIGDSDQDR